MEVKLVIINIHYAPMCLGQFIAFLPDCILSISEQIVQCPNIWSGVRVDRIQSSSADDIREGQLFGPKSVVRACYCDRQAECSTGLSEID